MSESVVASGWLWVCFVLYVGVCTCVCAHKYICACAFMHASVSYVRVFRDAVALRVWFMAQGGKGWCRCWEGGCSWLAMVKH